MKTLYVGSFDPITIGHEWVIRNAPGELIVAVANNPEKKYMFSIQDRITMVHETCRIIDPLIKVISIGNKYLVRHAEDLSVSYIIRGIRNEADFQYEKAYRDINESISRKHIPHLILIPPAHLRGVSSSVVKSLVGPDGWEEVVSEYVSPIVLGALRAIQTNR